MSENIVNVNLNKIVYEAFDKFITLHVSHSLDYIFELFIFMNKNCVNVYLRASLLDSQ